MSNSGNSSRAFIFASDRQSVRSCFCILRLEPSLTHCFVLQAVEILAIQTASKTISTIPVLSCINCFTLNMWCHSITATNPRVCRIPEYDKASSDRYGSVIAAGDNILSVRSEDMTTDTLCKIQGFRIFPSKTREFLQS